MKLSNSGAVTWTHQRCVRAGRCNLGLWLRDPPGPAPHHHKAIPTYANRALSTFDYCIRARVTGKGRHTSFLQRCRRCGRKMRAARYPGSARVQAGHWQRCGVRRGCMRQAGTRWVESWSLAVRLPICCRPAFEKRERRPGAVLGIRMGRASPGRGRRIRPKEANESTPSISRITNERASEHLRPPSCG